MIKRPKSDVIAFCLLVVAGAIARIYFQEIPNFAPVAAISLFAGYYFRSALLACLVPLCVMAVSDSVIGTYELSVRVAVYGMLTAPVFCRTFLRRAIPFDTGRFETARPEWNRPHFGRSYFGSISRAVFGLVGCGLLASVAFFLVTNWVVWLNWYEPTFDGLVTCYLNALPFFRFTLLGDLVFSIALFGSYGFLMRVQEIPESCAGFRKVTADI